MAKAGQKPARRRIMFMQLALSNDAKATALTTYILLRTALENQGQPEGTSVLLTDELIDELTQEWLRVYGRTRGTFKEIEDYGLRHGKEIVSSTDWIEFP